MKSYKTLLFSNKKRKLTFVVIVLSVALVLLLGDDLALVHGRVVVGVVRVGAQVRGVQEVSHGAIEI